MSLFVIYYLKSLTIKAREHWVILISPSIGIEEAEDRIADLKQALN